MCRIAHCNACLRVIIPIKMDHFNTARHLKKPRSRYLGRGFALKSFLEVSYILQHLETRVRIYTISIDPDICEL